MEYLNNLSLLLDSTEKPEWIVKSFPTIQIVIAIVLTICSLFMIVAVVAQKGEGNGSSALTGQADTYYNRNKNSSLQGKLKKLVMIDAVLILVLSIAFVILSNIYAIQ